MAKNRLCDGDIFTYTNNTGVDIKSGDPVLMGDTLGVAQVDIPDDLSGSVEVCGVYEIRKTTGTISQGAKLYWDADGNPVGATSENGLSGIGALTTTSSGNVYAGKAYAAAASTDATVHIRLDE